MSEEYTLNDVVGLLTALTGKVDNNTAQIASLTTKVDVLDEKVSMLDEKVSMLDENVSGNTSEIKSLTETVNDILHVSVAHSEKMDAKIDHLVRTSATKDDIAKVREEMATKADLGTLQDNLYNQLLNVDKKTNVRVDTVVEVLDTQKVTTPAQTAHLLTMDPFPKMAS